MAGRWRQGWVFGLGLAVGIAAAVGMVAGWRATEPGQAQAAPVPQQVASAGGMACGLEPLVPVASPADGKFGLNIDLTDKLLSDVAAYTAVAGDAANHGRVRDAEVAYLTACRIAGQISGTDSQEVAQAKYDLARHYMAMSVASTDTVRNELLKRAESLYGESMNQFAARLGQGHERTRLAAAGLTLSRQAFAMASQVKTPVIPDAALAAVAAAAGTSTLTAVMGAAPAEPPKPKRRKVQPPPELRDDVVSAPPMASEPPRVERYERAPSPSAGEASGGSAEMQAP